MMKIEVLDAIKFIARFETEYAEDDNQADNFRDILADSKEWPSLLFGNAISAEDLTNEEFHLMKAAIATLGF